MTYDPNDPNFAVYIECTDNTLCLATLSGYNNATNQINISANIPAGKTVARVLASQAWIDVPDVLSNAVVFTANAGMDATFCAG